MPGPTSGRQLAKSLGKSQSAVRKWFAHDAWPFGRSGPWDIAAVKSWAAKHIGANPAAEPETTKPPEGSTRPPAEISEERRAKLDLIRERRRKLKHENGVNAGLYLLKSDVEIGRLERVEAVKSALLSLPKLATQLVGMTELEIATVLEAETIKILNDFSRERTA